MGHIPSDVYVDKLGIEIQRGSIEITQIMDRSRSGKVDVDGAFLRHLGTIKDYEQFNNRIWSVMAMEQNGTCVINEVVSWLYASDKFASLSALAKRGLPVPKTFVSEDMFGAYNAAKGMKEVVVKRLTGSMGVGVFRTGDPDFAMHVFSSLTSMNKPIYVQKYLDKKGGGDYRVIVIGGRVIGTEFRKGKDWKSNIAQGGKALPAKADAEMAELAIKAAGILKLDHAGIDIADTKEGYFILEANPTYSWQGFKKATKINVADVLVKHLIKKIKS